MGKKLNMQGFDEVTDNIEEFINKQGFTLGEQADRLQELMRSICYCYIHGVVTDSQAQQMNEKFMKQFKGALKEMEEKPDD